MESLFLVLITSTNIFVAFLRWFVEIGGSSHGNIAELFTCHASLLSNDSRSVSSHPRSHSKGLSSANHGVYRVSGI